MVFGTHTGHYSMSSFTTDPLTLRMTRMQLNREGTSSYDERTDLTYDPAGNITQAKATLAGGTVDNQCFGYDYQQQLTEAWTPNTGVCDPNARSQAGLGGPAPYWVELVDRHDREDHEAGGSHAQCGLNDYVQLPG
jgi:hypothetical protein